MPKGRFQNTRSAEPRFFLPPKKFGKRSDVFQILMPTAPTRIKLLPPRWHRCFLPAAGSYVAP